MGGWLRDLWRSRFRVVPLVRVEAERAEHAQERARLGWIAEDRRRVLAQCHGYPRAFPGTGDKRRAITAEIRAAIEKVAS